MYHIVSLNPIIIVIYIIYIIISYQLPNISYLIQGMQNHTLAFIGDSMIRNLGNK